MPPFLPLYNCCVLTSPKTTQPPFRWWFRLGNLHSAIVSHRNTYIGMGGIAIVWHGIIRVWWLRCLAIRVRAIAGVGGINHLLVVIIILICIRVAGCIRTAGWIRHLSSVNLLSPRIGAR